MRARTLLSFRSPGLRALLFVLTVTPPGIAAQSAVVLGEVRTSEDLAVPAAEVAIYRDGGVLRRAVADAQGLYRLVGLSPGRYRVEASSVGYATAARDVELAAGQILRLDLILETSAVRLDEIRVRANRPRVRFEEEVGATVAELAGADIESLPGLAEADVLRAVEVLPGVVSTSDFAASFNVRGGAADQNLILLDGIPIYNPFHLGGVFSVFNSDMVERANLLAGGFPARYGGRVSSVLDVRSDAGDGDLAVDAGISLLASRVTLGAGLSRDQTPGGLGPVNARISARRSYFDVLLSPFFDFPYYLTDIQAVAEVWTENGVWTLSGYTGDDVLDLRDSQDFPLRFRLGWGNDVGGIRWNGRLAGVRVDARASSSGFETAIRFPDFEDTRIGSRISDRRGALDLGIPLGGGLDLGVGGEVVRIEYENGVQSGGTSFQQAADRGWRGAGYTQLAWESNRWRVEAGARLDIWNPESTEAFVNPAPRLAVKRFFGNDVAVKASVGRFTQALHSLRDEELPIGIDTWVTAGAGAPVVVSDQAQAGVEAFFGGWNGSAEVYYRSFEGVVALNGAEDPNDPNDDLLVGDGTSWGVDLLLRREPDPERWVDGWIAVSYLKAARSFPDPFSGLDRTVTYPPIFDRRLDVDLVLRAPLPGGIDAGLRFNFGSGLPYTRPVGAYPVWSYQVADGSRELGVGGDNDDELQTAVVLGDRNAERYPPYHRLDISFRRTYERSWGSFTPFVDLLNLYNRRDNVLFYFYDYQADPSLRTRVSMLPIIPTLGVEVSF